MKKRYWVYLLAVLLAALWTAGSALAGRPAQDAQPVVWLDGTVEIEPLIESAIIDYLATNPPAETTVYAPTARLARDGGIWVAIAGLRPDAPATGWNIQDDAVWLGSVMVRDGAVELYQPTARCADCAPLGAGPGGGEFGLAVGTATGQLVGLGRVEPVLQHRMQGCALALVVVGEQFLQDVERLDPIDPEPWRQRADGGVVDASVRGGGESAQLAVLAVEELDSAADRSRSDDGESGQQQLVLGAGVGIEPGVEPVPRRPSRLEVPGRHGLLVFPQRGAKLLVAVQEAEEACHGGRIPQARKLAAQGVPDPGVGPPPRGAACRARTPSAASSSRPRSGWAAPLRGRFTPRGGADPAPPHRGRRLGQAVVAPFSGQHSLRSQFPGLVRVPALRLRSWT